MGAEVTVVEQVLNKNVFEKLTGAAYDHYLPMHEILYICKIWLKPVFQAEHTSAASSLMRVIHTQ